MPNNFVIFEPSSSLTDIFFVGEKLSKVGSKVKVIRNENKMNRVFYVDLTRNSLLNNTDFMLHPHDIIYVAPLRKKFYAFNNITNIVSMSISAVTLFLLINQK